MLAAVLPWELAAFVRPKNASGSQLAACLEFVPTEHPMRRPQRFGDFKVPTCHRCHNKSPELISARRLATRFDAKCSIRTTILPRCSAVRPSPSLMLGDAFRASNSFTK